jgi:hypothetical protein
MPIGPIIRHFLMSHPTNSHKSFEILSNDSITVSGSLWSFLTKQLSKFGVFCDLLIDPPLCREAGLVSCLSR